MITLLNSATGDTIATTTEEQLQILIDILEEEWEDDRDYYIDGPTIDLLAERGADPALIDALRQASDAEGLDMRWNRTS